MATLAGSWEHQRRVVIKAEVLANQFRLLLHAAAYTLLDTVRRWLMRCRVPRMELATLRLRLIKIGGWVR